jgi:hypothetical protein
LFRPWICKFNGWYLKSENVFEIKALIMNNIF